MKNGETPVSDDMGNAGTLTQEQIDSILSNVYYRNDKSNADIVIVEYSDILCPFCQRHYNGRTIENILDADSSVALAFKNMPLAQLHPNAPLGAK
jgi:protein-disulfide isomerase